MRPHPHLTSLTLVTRCGVFYGPALVTNQWVEIDCGYRKGITGRYLSIQLLDRSIPAGGGKMEIREVQVEGWARSCGKLLTISAQPQLNLNRKSFYGLCPVHPPPPP